MIYQTQLSFTENKIHNGLYNIGSGIEVSIFELVNKIKNFVGFKGRIQFDKNKPDGNPRKLLDSSKINKLGWSATTFLIKAYNKLMNGLLKNIKIKQHLIISQKLIL